MKENIFPAKYSFIRYLASKKTVDDRALNQGVWKQLKSEIKAEFQDREIRILELGAGIGTMIERLLEWDFFPYFHYTALDAEPENISHAVDRLWTWADANNFEADQTSETNIILKKLHTQVEIHFETRDVYEFLKAIQGKRLWDLVIAHAFLDIVDIPSTLLLVSKIAERGAFFYFTLNFDGMTTFQPEFDEAFEEMLLNQYHHTMDTRIINGKPQGDSRSGRHLFNYLLQAGYQVSNAGASDWVVFPVSDHYLYDEAYFLHFIINTIQSELIKSHSLDTKRLLSWVKERNRQIDNCELAYTAHQLDFMGRIHFQGS